MRNQETASEDPYTSAQYATQFTLGLQEGCPGTVQDPRYLLAASTLKHLVGYSLEDWSPSGVYSDHTYTRQTFNANVTQRDLNDTCASKDRTRVCSPFPRQHHVYPGTFLLFATRSATARRRE
jgi:beta-glucosidase-like glycosyl hydrolase